jgi:hypothetical protein
LNCGIWAPDPREVERLAYFYCERRGYARGFHEEDWHRAVEELRRRGPKPEESTTADRTVLGVFHAMRDAQRGVPNES